MRLLSDEIDAFDGPVAQLAIAQLDREEAVEAVTQEAAETGFAVVQAVDLGRAGVQAAVVTGRGGEGGTGQQAQRGSGEDFFIMVFSRLS
jgi:hypothetical protein